MADVNSVSMGFWPRPAPTPQVARLGLAAFIGLVLAVSLYRLACTVWPGLAFFPDESYYYSWSLEPDFGYFSKPPIIAWLIGLSTSLFGNAEWAIRLPSLACYSSSAIVVYLLVRRLYDDTTAFVAGALFLTLPTVAFFSRFITTDAPLMLCWSIALWCFIGALERDRARDYALAGLWIGLGLQSKYSMIVFFASALLFLLSERELAKRLLTLRVHWGWITALIVFAPNLIWNLQHDFVSIEHTAEISQLDRKLFHPEHLAEFSAAQLIVFGPILFPLLWWSLGFVLAEWRERKLRLFAAFCFPFLGLILVQSLLSRAFYNWAAPAYISATILLTVYCLNHRRYRTLLLAAALNVFVGATAYHYTQIWQYLSGPMERKFDIYARLRGWPEVGAQLQDRIASANTISKPDFVVFDDRKSMANLMYYAPASAANGRIWNTTQRISDHYRLVRDAAEENAANVLLVIKHLPPAYLEQRCDNVQRLAPLAAHPHRDQPLTFEVYQASNCRYP